MITDKYKIPLLLLFVFNLSCKGQSQVESTERAIYIDVEDLKGPIKSVFTYYDYISDSLKFKKRGPFTDQKRNLMRYNIDIGTYRYLDFDEKRRKIATTNWTTGWFAKVNKSTIPPKKIKRYYYDEKDWEIKNKIKVKNRPPYQGGEDLGYIQLPKSNYISEGYKVGTIQPSEDSLEYFNGIYIYILDEKGRIKKEKDYYKVKSETAEVDESDLVKTTYFLYDKKGNLIRQNITSGEFGRGMPYNAMGTESGFCEDLHLAYEYDAKDRLTKAVFFGCGDTLATQEFTYHPTKDYVTKMKRYVGGVGGDFQVTKNTVFHYDEYGSIIQRDYVPKEGQDLGLPVSTYYKYDYDKYHNWYKCYIYMEGTQEGEPTAIITRELEYYEN